MGEAEFDRIIETIFGIANADMCMYRMVVLLRLLVMGGKVKPADTLRYYAARIARAQKR